MKKKQIEVQVKKSQKRIQREVKEGFGYHHLTETLKNQGRKLDKKAEHLRNLPLGVGIVAYSGQPFLVRFRPYYHKPNV